MLVCEVKYCVCGGGDNGNPVFILFSLFLFFCLLYEEVTEPMETAAGPGNQPFPTTVTQKPQIPGQANYRF